MAILHIDNDFYEVHEEVQEYVTELTAEIEKLKIEGKIYELRANELQAELDKHHWIPVSERLPEESGCYQAIRKINQYPTTREYCAKSLMWMSQDTVTHWKPIILPEQALKGE